MRRGKTGTTAIVWIKRKLVVCLSKEGLVRRMSNWSEAWSLLTKLWPQKLVLPGVFSLTETICPKIWAKPLSTCVTQKRLCERWLPVERLYRLKRFLDHYSDSVAIGTIDGRINCTEIRIHTSGGPIIEYMRKKWKYCCKWRPCSGTSFFNRPSTAVKIWSLSVALLSSSAKQRNNKCITTNSRKFLSKK